ncbi:MAG: hypothetical protein ACI89E_000058 [Planctomycetota bacterium]|jgi:hypothetical protein
MAFHPNRFKGFQAIAEEAQHLHQYPLGTSSRKLLDSSAAGGPNPLCWTKHRLVGVACVVEIQTIAACPRPSGPRETRQGRYGRLPASGPWECQNSRPHALRP